MRNQGNLPLSNAGLAGSSFLEVGVLKSAPGTRRLSAGLSGPVPTTRRLLLSWVLGLLGLVLALVLILESLLVRHDLERRALHEMNRHLIETWEPRPHLGPPPPPVFWADWGHRPHHFPGDVGPRGPSPLQWPSSGQPSWDRLASGRICVRFYDAAGRMVVGRARVPELPAERPQEIASVLNSESHWRTYTSSNGFESFLMWAQPVVNAAGVPVGVLEMGTGQRPAQDLAHDLLTGLALVSVVGLLVGMTVAGRLASRLARPLEKMSRAMEGVSAGDLSLRVSAGGTREQRSVADGFNRMVAQLERAFEAERRFIADASHELKTPLTSLTTMADLLRERSADMSPERAERAWLVISRELERMDRLVRDLLMLSRIEQGEFEPEVVDLAEVAETLGEEYEARHPNLVLEIAVRPARTRVLDQHGCFRAIRNLVDNALAHTPSFGTVWLRLMESGGAFVVEVADQGSGIPAEDLGQLTRRFYRSDVSRSRHSGGTGLGLSIVAAWVGRSGGRLEIDSVLGQGTVARLVIPVTA